MQKPFFSIIVVSLNAGEELKKTLESVSGQSCRDYEVILKDGGSEDGSLDFLREAFGDGSLDVLKEASADDSPDFLREASSDDSLDVLKEASGRVRLCEKKDRGIYDAMNQALKLATGDYFLFLNCGDYLYDNLVLERVKEKIEVSLKSGLEDKTEWEERKIRAKETGSYGTKTVPRIFYGDLYNRKQQARISSSPEITDFTLFRNVPCHQVCFYHKSLFEKRAYDLKYRVRADYEHFLYCIKERKATAQAMHLVTASYEGGGFSETEKNRRISAREHKEITRKYLGIDACRKYRLILWLTLAPVRSKIAENPRLALGYNRVKSMIYKMKGRHKEK